MHDPSYYFALAVIYLPVTAALAALALGVNKAMRRSARNRRRDVRRRYHLPSDC
jgi:hypothetical protein